METHPENQSEQQKATKSIFHSQFHSFASTLDLLKVVDIKSNEKPKRATTGNEKQQKATKSNKKRKWTSELEKPKWAIKNQNEQQKAQKVHMETRLKQLQNNVNMKLHHGCGLTHPHCQLILFKIQVTLLFVYVSEASCSWRC